MPVAAPLIGAAVSVGGSLLSSSATSSAAQAAAAAQTQADQQAIAEQKYQYDTTRSDLMPFQTAGKSALGSQGDLLGLNGGAAQQSAITSLQNSPLYQSLFSTGENTLLANASATGGLRTGNTNDALAQFGENTLSSVIQNQLTNLGGISSLGENAAAQTGQFGANSADAISSLLGNQGAAQASADNIAGKADANSISSITGTLSGLVNNNAIQSALGKLF